MRVVMALSLLVACGPSVEIQVESNACTDVNLADPPDAELVVEEDGADLLVYVHPDFAGGGDLFVPEIEDEGHRLLIREKWEVADEGAEQLCINPTLRLVDVPSGTWKFIWYEGDAVAPLFNVEYEI
jgi:hypothetical protein